ncbi:MULTISPECIES: hypothetical protein [Micrococcaceae]|jgi:hypothetical protein|uniref:hypothetical protein n=1 Tax=Micrococcaceae TaxID=1268 RepID=UPI000B1F3C44|nr:MULTISPECIES: hypothetical protein [Micrococcaceae]BCW43215.1 hypothetical protein StoSoilB5_03990 [Arthrobacter sp. StoSoilB5]
MKQSKHAVEVKDWSVLKAGEMVAIADDPYVQDPLRVEETAPELGVLWVRRQSSGDRQILNSGDFKIWRLT